MQIRMLMAAAMLLAAAAPVTAGAQDTTTVEVRPGGAMVDASRVSARTDTFEMALRQGERALLVARTALLGDSALLRVERIVAGPLEVTEDSFAARRPGLAPLFDHSDEPSAVRHLTFAPGRVFGKTASASGSPRAVSQRLDPPAFYSNTTDLVLASLPLAEGRAFDLPMWSPEMGSYVMHARVVRAEAVRTVDGGRCDAWRIETEEPENRSIYWVEKASQSLLAYASGGTQIRIIRHAACPADDATRRAR